MEFLRRVNIKENRIQNDLSTLGSYITQISNY